jgi:outer membrane protein assembly factor BamB
MLRTLTKALVLLVLSFLLNFSATAANLVMFDGDNYSLYNFDTATGLATLRTPISGYHRFIAMDQRPSDGTVFAVNAGDLDPSGLYTININTGALSLIGAFGISGSMDGVAFNPLNGQLFGLRYAGGRLGELWSINEQTGAATLIGSTGSVDQGLVCSPSGQLFGFDRFGSLYRIDPATAATTLVGGSGTYLDILDAAFDPSGTLYAYNHSGGGIYRIDTVTGNGTQISSTPFQFNPLGLIVAPVPEPGAAALGIIGVTMLFLFRRNSRG